MRKWFSVLMVALTLCAASQVSVAKPVTVTDVTGRTVQVDAPVKTMILGEGRFLPAIAILDPATPAARIAGMMGEFKRFDPAGYAQYLARFPEIANIPVIGQGSAESFSLEKSITVKPDVAVFSLGSGHGPGARHKQIIETLKAAGVPVVVVDFRIEPLVNTPKSIALLGRIMGLEARAKAFNDFYQAELARVRDGLKGVTVKPSVFIEIHVGGRDDCCATMSHAMMGRFIDWAGGHNIATDKIPGTHGLLSMEYLLTAQPDVYIGTAIGSAGVSYDKPGRIVLGPDADPVLARRTLAEAVQRPGFNELQAVKSGRAHAVWHHFYNTPINVAAVQAMAKWIHPERFSDLDPEDTLMRFFDRFQPFPLNGTYWASTGAGQ